MPQASEQLLQAFADDPAFTGRYSEKSEVAALGDAIAVTYETQAHAADTYETKADVAATYATKAEVATAERVPSKAITENYTVTPADHGLVLEVDSTSPVVITVNPDSAALTTEGHVTEIVRFGTGAVTVAHGAWVDIRSEGNKRAIAAVNAGASLRHRHDANRWHLNGRLA